MNNVFRTQPYARGLAVSLVALVAIAGIAEAATTISSNISTGGTLAVTGAATLSSTLTVSGVSTLTDLSILQAGGAAPRFNASSTAVSIGNGTPVSALRLGTCAVNPQSIAAATSSPVATSCTATGVTSSDKIFMTPPLNAAYDNNWLIFEGASASSTAGYIEITLFNASTTAAIDGPARTWSWMAVRP